MDKQITPSNQCIWCCEYQLPGTLDIHVDDVAGCFKILSKNTHRSEFYLIKIMITRQETLEE